MGYICFNWLIAGEGGIDLDSEMEIIKAKTPKEYLENLPIERRAAVEQLRKVILENLPDGFEEVISYGMLGYVVPHRLYPAGYHVNPKEPLPFINLASQKQYIAFYHMGIYALPDLLAWFEKEYAARVKGKLDMGKSWQKIESYLSLNCKNERGDDYGNEKKPGTCHGYSRAYNFNL